jgi:AcrR family transcriptional regulator
MGRPRRHGTETAERLLDAAERIVEADGLDALTVRRVAEEVGTTTRAVYSVFGSKDGLVVGLGIRAFDFLREALTGVPETDDPGADLVEAGVHVFRRFALEHPSLFEIGFRECLPEAVRDAADAAMVGLTRRVERVEDAGMLGDRTVSHAVLAFDSLCEGLAVVELRGRLPEPDGERVWRDALGALVRGFAVSPAGPREARGRRG